MAHSGHFELASGALAERPGEVINFSTKNHKSKKIGVNRKMFQTISL